MNALTSLYSKPCPMQNYFGLNPPLVFNGCFYNEVNERSRVDYVCVRACLWVYVCVCLCASILYRNAKRGQQGWETKYVILDGTKVSIFEVEPRDGKPSIHHLPYGRGDLRLCAPTAILKFCQLKVISVCVFALYLFVCACACVC